LILLVASIPVAMPAVFSITMARRARLVKRRRSSRGWRRSEMASVDILCSDKTGTLTEPAHLGEPILLAAKDGQEVILAGALASSPATATPRRRGDRRVKDAGALGAYRCTNFVPFDPVSKRTQATVVDLGGDLHRRGARRRSSRWRASPAVAGKVENTVADLGQAPALGRAPTTAARPGRCSASCRCSIRPATIPRHHQAPNARACASRW
jgi:H+-transporting ATPase